MNPGRSVWVEGGRKPVYDVLLATERHLRMVYEGLWCESMGMCNRAANES